MMRLSRYRSITVVVIGVFIWLIMSITAYAKDATITFGTTSFDAVPGDVIPITVYINAEDNIGRYSVLLRFDTDRLEYLTGADEADIEHNILTLESDEISSNEARYILSFKAVSGGTANVQVTDSRIYTGKDTNETFGVYELPEATITIEGEGIAVSDDEPTDMSPGSETEDGSESATETNGGANAGISSELYSLIGGKSADSQDAVSGDNSGTDGADEIPGGDSEPAWYRILMLNPIIVGLIAVVLVFIIVEAILLLILRKREKSKVRKRRIKELTQRSEERKRRIAEMEYDDSEPEEAASVAGKLSDLDEDRYPIIDQKTEDKLREERGEPVISVVDVTMEFKMYQNEASGLKEFLILAIKQQVTYRRLFALYHVSFNVFRGEVVGIIGTNGSGKSTVLKIVSGALTPTSGHVEVDRKKLQILTLGTGFDMELTGRENVYLNGAIIGYTREFMDEHYDEIVAFAELGDFMDEKVKNYSSGMVSRLGFAIATAGDAAEILILDEVLSVGDEFFRKKSLARIKEMIHGGSTVLMVSHGMGTIIEHCTKAVWIEKGVLRMVGQPKVVCKEYQKLGESA